MSKRQNSTRGILDGVTLRRKDAAMRRSVAEPSYSPLLIIQSSKSRINDLVTRSSSCFENDVLEVNKVAKPCKRAGSLTLCIF